MINFVLIKRINTYFQDKDTINVDKMNGLLINYFEISNEKRK
jgi:hypothetical protein